MSLRRRLVAYLAINVVILAIVSAAGYELSSELDKIVHDRVRLGNEMQIIRKLHQTELEQVDLAYSIVIDPKEEEIAWNESVAKTVNQQTALLAKLPPSPGTKQMLIAWQKENTEFWRLFRQLSTHRRAYSAEQLKTVFQSLRKEADDEFNLLQLMDDGVRDQLQATGAEMELVMAGHWREIIALTFFPIVVCIALFGSFASRLSSQVSKLDRGFQRLAEGNFDVRLSSPGTDPAGDEIAVILDGFDRTAEKLQKAKELKSRFYSMAAHDLRSPLNTMLLALYGLKDPHKSASDRALYVDVMERRIKVVLKLVETLLDSFFLKSGQVHALRQHTDVNELLKRSIADLEVQATERGQTIALEPLEGDPALECDPGKLAQILENLVVNAIKYSRQGDTIAVSASRQADGAVQFSVRDNGSGVPKEEQQDIFEPFHRVSGPSQEVEGRGLGLAICKEFVTAHGGRIWVESEPGAGACFSFVIPAEEKPRVPQPAGT